LIDSFLSRTLKRETNVFFHVIGKLLTKHVLVRARTLRFGSVKNLFFHKFIHRFTPTTLGFTNKMMTAKISAKKWEISICKKPPNGCLENSESFTRGKC